MATKLSRQIKARYRRDETTFHSNYAMLLPFFLHPERPEVHRAGTPWLLPTSCVCSTPASIYLTLHPAVSVQWGFAYSETEKTQEVRFWWCSLEGWSKVSENKDTDGQCACLSQVTTLNVKRLKCSDGGGREERAGEGREVTRLATGGRYLLPGGN